MGEHGVLEEGRLQKVGIAHPGESGLRRILAEAFGGDAIPDFAHAGKSLWQGARVGPQFVF